MNRFSAPRGAVVALTGRAWYQYPMVKSRFVFVFLAIMTLAACGGDTSTSASDATDPGDDGVATTDTGADATPTDDVADTVSPADTVTDEDAPPVGEDARAANDEGSSDEGGEDDFGKDAGKDVGKDVAEPPTPCESLCGFIVTAACDGGPGLEACVEGCEALALECPDQVTALAACVTPDTELVCLDGEALAVGCEQAINDVVACTETPCHATCQAIVSAGCIDDVDTLEDCVGGCQASAEACPAEFATTQTCIDGEELDIVCDGGFAAFKGCEDEQNALLACVDPCLLYCQGVSGAGCANGPPSFSACIAGCAAAKGSCPAEFQTTAACIGTDLDFLCVADEPVAKGCEAEQATLLTCVAGSAPGGFCEEACESVVAAGCANGPDTVESCVVGCKDAASGPCAAEQQNVVTCAGTEVGAYVCLEPAGFPSPEGCEAESTLLAQCLAENLPPS